MYSQEFYYVPINVTLYKISRANIFIDYSLYTMKIKDRLYIYERKLIKSYREIK